MLATPHCPCRMQAFSLPDLQLHMIVSGKSVPILLDNGLFECSVPGPFLAPCHVCCLDALLQAEGSMSRLRAAQLPSDAYS